MKKIRATVEKIIQSTQWEWTEETKETDLRLSLIKCTDKWSNEMKYRKYTVYM